MMKTSMPLYRVATAILCLSFIFQYCSKGDGGSNPPPDPCANTSITVTASVIDADAGQSNGTISAAASGSSGFTFQLNSGSFQSSGDFASLAPGTYTITAKDSKGCTKSSTFTINQKSACTGVTLTVTPSVSQNSDGCQPTGAISVTASGATNLTYKLDNGSFQPTATFSGVAVGNHTITVRDEATGCTSSAPIAMPAEPAGPLFTEVKAIVAGHCALSGCHTGSAPTGGINFSIECNIVAQQSRIKARAIDAAGTAQQMPQPPNAALSVADRNKITEWMNAGGKYSN
jgi:hypothetical protein